MPMEREIYLVGYPDQFYDKSFWDKTYDGPCVPAFNLTEARTRAQDLNDPRARIYKISLYRAGEK